MRRKGLFLEPLRLGDSLKIEGERKEGWPQDFHGELKSDCGKGRNYYTTVEYFNNTKLGLWPNSKNEEYGRTQPTDLSTMRSCLSIRTTHIQTACIQIPALPATSWRTLSKVFISVPSFFIYKTEIRTIPMRQPIRRVPYTPSAISVLAISITASTQQCTISIL